MKVRVLIQRPARSTILPPLRPVQAVHRAAGPTLPSPLALLTSRIASQETLTGLRIHGIEKLGDLHHHLSFLAYHELFALQSRQMLGDSWPRGSHQVGDVLVAEGHAQQRTARLLDSKVRAQFQQRGGYSFVQAKVQKT